MQMIDAVQSTDKPEKIKICQGTTFSTASDNTLYTTPDIIGFQLYYGQGANELSGPAHGDVSSNCLTYQFPSVPIGVDFYTDTNLPG